VQSFIKIAWKLWSFDWTDRHTYIQTDIHPKKEKIPYLVKLETSLAALAQSTTTTAILVAAPPIGTITCYLLFSGCHYARIRHIQIMEVIIYLIAMRMRMVIVLWNLGDWQTSIQESNTLVIRATICVAYQHCGVERTVHGIPLIHLIVRVSKT